MRENWSNTLRGTLLLGLEHVSIYDFFYIFNLYLMYIILLPSNKKSVHDRIAA
jgi:hypothetical protein